MINNKIDENLIIKRQAISIAEEEGKITRDKYYELLFKLNGAIYKQLHDIVDLNMGKTKEKINKLNTIYGPNEFKKQVAKLLYETFLKNNLEQDVIRGIFRHGYKMLK